MKLLNTDINDVVLVRKKLINNKVKSKMKNKNIDNINLAIYASILNETFHYNYKQKLQKSNPYLFISIKELMYLFQNDFFDLENDIEYILQLDKVDNTLITEELFKPIYEHYLLIKKSIEEKIEYNIMNENSFIK